MSKKDFPIPDMPNHSDVNQKVVNHKDAGGQPRDESFHLMHHPGHPVLTSVFLFFNKDARWRMDEPYQTYNINQFFDNISDPGRLRQSNIQHWKRTIDALAPSDRCRVAVGTAAASQRWHGSPPSRDGDAALGLGPWDLRTT